MFKTLSDISSTRAEQRLLAGDDTLPLPQQKVGIEIELEGVSPSTLHNIADSGYWQIHSESSLRGDAGELVSTPIFGKDITKALNIVVDGFKRTRKPKFNARTSTHIHMEAVDLDLEQLMKFILIYSTFELVLFRLCDETRQKQIYCLPTYLSEATKKDTADLFRALEDKAGSTTSRILGRWPKYNAMNLQNIIGIGTVEFRQLHGTINKEEILDWIKILMSLKRYAMEEMETYNDLPTVVSGFSPLEYVEKVFGKELASKLNSPHLAEDLLTGVRCAQDILLYRRLSKATDAIYSKQSGKEPSSFERITSANIEDYKAKLGFMKGRKKLKKKGVGLGLTMPSEDWLQHHQQSVTAASLAMAAGGIITGTSPISPTAVQLTTDDEPEEF